MEGEGRSLHQTLAKSMCFLLRQKHKTKQTFLLMAAGFQGLQKVDVFLRPFKG